MCNKFNKTLALAAFVFSASATTAVLVCPNPAFAAAMNPAGLGGDAEFNTLPNSPPFGQRGFAGGTVSASMGITLSNKPGPGTVSVGVDEFGSFGRGIGGNGTSDAFYTPVGENTAGTVAQSGLIVRPQGEDPVFLSSGSFYFTSGGENEMFLSTSSNFATSSFSFDSLLFNLEQTLTDQLDENNSQTGSVLTQTYTITNTSPNTQKFDLFRWLDPTLNFVQTGIDGGGRINTSDFGDLLFVTDTISSNIDPFRSVGITATGGTVPAVGRYQVDSFDAILLCAITPDPTRGCPNLGQLSDRVDDDSDLTLVLNNIFSLGAGETATYTTRTIFGVGNPGIKPDPKAVPEPTSTFGLVALGIFGASSVLKRKQKSSTGVVSTK